MSESSDPRPASSHVGSKPGGGWVPPAVEELQALLTQYEILSMLGHGGMGAVYKGKQKSLDRLVAIKILPPGLDDDDAKFTERFKNEARTMARLNHPGIVSVYDFGETAEGQFYFVMEYVDGTDVAKMIQSSVKLPPDHALAITAHVCDALGYAHANGVIHRDIKPANILINMQGQVKVADFGLAKQDDPSMTSGLTKTGMAMGTPDFVAPEALIMGVNVDGRADLYAIGVMLYQMLTGDIPRGLFLMPSVKTNGEIDPRFDRIITRAMQTDREERYQTASEIRKDLDVILTTPRVKQDASKAVAAVPEGAMKNVPGQRSAAPKPMPKGPGQPGAKAAAAPAAGGSDPGHAGKGAPGSMSRATGEKSKTGLYLGLAAGIAVIGGAAFLFSGGKGSGGTPAADSSPSTAPTSGGKSAATPAAPIKVAESPQPKPPPPAANPVAGGADLPVITGWQDLMATAKETIPRLGHTEVKEEDGWLVTSKYNRFGSVHLGTKSLKDAALRGRVRGFVNVGLRNDNTLPGYYSVRFKKGGIGTIEQVISAPSKVVTLAGFTMSAVDEHDFLVTMTGPDIRLWVDGALVATARDTAIASGTPVIALNAEGAAIRDLAIAELPVDFFAQAPAISTSNGEQWVDALANWWANSTNAQSGQMTKEGEGSRVVGRSDNSSFYIPCGTHENVALRATLRGGSAKEWCFLLRNSPHRSAAGGRRITYQVVMNSEAYGIIALEDGSKETRLATLIVPPGFSFADRLTVEVSIKGDEIVCLLNGHEAGRAKDATLRGANTAATFVTDAGLLIEKLEYRDLGSAAASPVVAGAGSDGWIDRLAEWWADSGKAGNGMLAREAGGSRVLIDHRGIDCGKQPDAAIRATAQSESGWGLQLRYSGEGADQHTYKAILSQSERSHIGLIRPASLGGPKTLKLFDLPPGSSVSDRHTMEFRAEGDLLTCILDGREVARVRDSTLKEGGRNMFFGAAGTLIEKLEYRDLGSAAAVAESAKDSTADSGLWSDALGPLLASGKLEPRVSRDGERLRFAQTGPQLLLDNRTLAGALSVRASARMEPVANAKGSHFWGITLNHGSNRAYSARVTRKGEVSLILFEPPPKEYTVLRTAQAGSSFDASASHTLEFRVAGQSRAVLLDGKEMISLSDSTYSNAPYLSLDAADGTVVEKIEYQEEGSSKRPTSEPQAAAPAAPAATEAPPAPPVDPKTATLQVQYTNAVTKAAAAAAPADKAAFDAELTRLKNNAPLPDAAEDAKLPAALKNLRGILRSQLPGAGAPAAKPAAEAPKAAASIPATAAQAKLTPEDVRALAGWVIDQKGSVTITKSGKASKIGVLSELPPGKLSISGITLADLADGESTQRNLARIGQLDDLEELEITRFNGAPPAAMLAGPQELRRLHLEGVGGLTDEALMALSAQKALAKLTVKACPQVKGSFVAALAKLSALREFTCSEPGLSKTSLPLLAELRAVETLYLHHSPGVGDAVLPHLAKLPELRELYLEMNEGLTGEPFATLSGFKKLQMIQLQNCGLTDAGLAAVAKNLPQLTSLTISREAKNLVSFDNLVQTLTQMKNLKQLTLIGPEMRDDIVPYIAKLPVVSLSFTGDARITEASVPELKKMTRLTTLGVGAKMSDAGIEELRKALPGCQVAR